MNNPAKRLLQKAKEKEIQETKETISGGTESKREAIVNVGANSTLKYVYNRGKMVGSEICVYAIRILGNISQYDGIAAKALGSDLGRWYRL